MNIDFNCITKAAWKWWCSERNYSTVDYNNRPLSIDEMKTITGSIRDDMQEILLNPLRYSKDIVLIIRLALALAYVNKVNMNKWVKINTFGSKNNNL